MDVQEAIRNRRSCRAYLSQEVPRQVLSAVLKDAVCAPSAINMQPWEFIVVSGEERLRLSRALMRAYRERQISCGPGNIEPLPEVVQRRRTKSFERLFPLLNQMGTDFNQFINEGSLNFYHAPVAVILTLHRAFSHTRFLDMGLTTAYFLLSAYHHGLATCPIGIICAYEDTIKETLNISEDRHVVLGIAVGYEDSKSVINEFRAPRDSLETFIRWVD
jgi:nitroreductase